MWATVQECAHPCVGLRKEQELKMELECSVTGEGWAEMEPEAWRGLKEKLLHMMPLVPRAADSLGSEASSERQSL